MDRMEWNGLVLGRRAGMLTWEEAELLSTRPTLRRAWFRFGFLYFMRFEFWSWASLSRRRSSAIRKVGSCASYGLDEVQKYGITPLLCTLLAAPFVMVEFCFFF